MDNTIERTFVREFSENNGVKRRLVEELDVSTEEDWCHVR